MGKSAAKFKPGEKTSSITDFALNNLINTVTSCHASDPGLKRGNDALEVDPGAGPLQVEMHEREGDNFLMEFLGVKGAGLCSYARGRHEKEAGHEKEEDSKNFDGVGAGEGVAECC